MNSSTFNSIIFYHAAIFTTVINQSLINRQIILVSLPVSDIVYAMHILKIYAFTYVHLDFNGFNCVTQHNDSCVLYAHLCVFLFNPTIY